MTASESYEMWGAAGISRLSLPPLRRLDGALSAPVELKEETQ